MADLFNNYYSVEGMTSREKISDLVNELNSRFGMGSDFAKENYSLLEFFISTDTDGNMSVCVYDEVPAGFVARYLSEQYPDKIVTFRSEDEFDPSCILKSEWRNGVCNPIDKTTNSDDKE